MAKKDRRAKKKTPFRVALRAVLWTLLAAVLVLFALWAIGSGHTARYARTLAPIGDNGLAYAIDPESGYYRFIKADGQDFTLLRAADLHLGCGLFSVQNDRSAVDALYTLVAQNRPDLIVLTGDTFFPVPFSSGTNNNIREANALIVLMEQLGIPWTVTFGNHDTEIYSFADREKLSRLFETADTEYCIYQPGPAELSGCGNTVIEVENADGTFNTAYILMDSNAYTDNSLTYDYDAIHADQVAWYTDTVRALAARYTGGDTRALFSIALWHIPCKEYQTAYDLYLAGSSEVEWMGIGENEEIDSYISEPAHAGEDTIFDAVVALGSTRYLFAAHDHYNSFGVRYKGVYLCYGLALDYLGYQLWDPDFSEKTAFRGVTVIRTDDRSAVTVLQDRLVAPDTVFSETN